ncbi:MAG: 50S ribosome-binding GTPase [Methylococcales bacterium]|nr:50S ribosome-binding GTPase [Methylococcales bacterium]
MTVDVIGNPNCGKTTLFHGLTGARQHVSNWAGVILLSKKRLLSILFCEQRKITNR